MRSARTRSESLIVVKTDCIMRSAGLVGIYWMALSYTETCYSVKRAVKDPALLNLVTGNFPGGLATKTAGPSRAVAPPGSWLSSGSS